MLLYDEVAVKILAIVIYSSVQYSIETHCIVWNFTALHYRYERHLSASNGRVIHVRVMTMRDLWRV